MLRIVQYQSIQDAISPPPTFNFVGYDGEQPVKERDLRAVARRVAMLAALDPFAAFCPLGNVPSGGGAFRQGSFTDVFQYTTVVGGMANVVQPITVVVAAQNYGGAFTAPETQYRKPFVSPASDDWALGAAQAIFSTTPQGGWASPSPELFVRPSRSALQDRHATLVPYPYAPFTFTAWGWASEPSIVFQRPLKAALQPFEFSKLVGQVPTAFFAPGYLFQQPERIVRLSAAQQQYAFGPIYPYTAFVQPAGSFVQTPDLFIKPFNSAQQRHADFAPAGFVTSTFQDGWRFQWFSERFVKALSASQQPHVGSLPPYPYAPFTFTAWGWASQSPDRFVKPLAAALIPFESSQYAGQVPSAFYPPAWTFQWASERFARPLAASQQQHGATAAYPVVVAYTIWGWASEAPTVNLRPTRLGAALAQFEAAQYIGQVPTQFVKPGWLFQWPERFIRPLSAAQQQHGAAPVYPYTSAVQTFFNWGWSSQSPDRFVAPLKAALQQFQALAPLGAVFSITPQGWSSWQPWIFRKPFLENPHVAEQPQFYAPPVPYGWWGQSPDLFGRRYTEMQFAAEARFSATFSTTPQGWASPSPDLFKRPFVEKPHAQIEPFQPPLAVPYGWQSQWPDRFLKALSSALQPHGPDYPQQGTVASRTPHGWENQYPNLFQRPIPASEQQFIFPTPRIVPIFARIIGHPQLLGRDAQAQLHGRDAAEQLQGKDAPTIVRATDARPILVGKDVLDRLKGKVES